MAGGRRGRDKMSDERWLQDGRIVRRNAVLWADYIEAASERVTAARALYAAQRYGEAIYLAGVAVECVLRAFAATRTTEFDAG